MDISEHISSGGFIKAPDLIDGPRREVIADVRPGKFERPDMEFQGGGLLSLNATNTRALANAWGSETDAWIGREVELYIGKTSFNGQERDSVLIKTISPAIPAGERAKPKPKTTARGDLDDEVPF